MLKQDRDEEVEEPHAIVEVVIQALARHGHAIVPKSGNPSQSFTPRARTSLGEVKGVQNVLKISEAEQVLERADHIVTGFEWLQAGVLAGASDSVGTLQPAQFLELLQIVGKEPFNKRGILEGQGMSGSPAHSWPRLVHDGDMVHVL